jgi:PLP dependent protein
VTVDEPLAINAELLQDLTARVRSGLVAVREVMHAGGTDPATVTIIAVTKGWGPEAPLAALANGLSWFGENYADELVSKALAVGKALDGLRLNPGFEEQGGPGPRWTFQGKLQTNKINRVKGFVELWQTVDSVDRAHALGSRVPGASALIQVVLEESGDRSGCSVADVPEVLLAARAAGVHVEGLMGVAPDCGLHGVEAASDAFAQLRSLAQAHQLTVLSMGMSDDYSLALACGATHLRLGSVLFGARA